MTQQQFDFSDHSEDAARAAYEAEQSRLYGSLCVFTPTWEELPESTRRMWMGSVS